MQASERPLLVGSAGLCDALSRRLAPQKQAVLAVVGSMSEIAQKQVSVAAQHPRCEHIFVDINDVFQSSATDYRAAIVAALNVDAIAWSIPARMNRRAIRWRRCASAGGEPR
jgi:uncharacterized protein YgbK (DUF1537 family)